MSDLIKRQDAIEKLECFCMVKALEDQNHPSTERKGKWINKNGIINCSVCGHCSWSMSFGHLVKSFNFCPNCGADMRGEEDE